RDHAFIDRLAPQLEPGGADENQLADLLADLHHLVQADASLIARVVAPVAALALLRGDLLRFFLREARFDERRRRVRVVFLAVRADAPDEPLRADQVHGAG